MKNIVLLAHDDAGQESRLQCALDLTRALEGHLQCVDVTRSPVFLQDYASTAGGMIAMVDEEHREAANAERLKARLSVEDVCWDLVEADGDFAEALVKHAGLADAIVISRRNVAGEVPDMMEVASDTVLKARGAVLVVPPEVKRLDLTGSMLVAWDGSPPASAALKAAIPLLSMAGRVIIYALDEEDRDIRCEDAARYLSRHGIKADIERNKSDGIFTQDVYLRNACERHRITLCIMGAYGHSRHLENIFGGVTRRMLVKTECPLMIAH